MRDDASFDFFGGEKATSLAESYDTPEPQLPQQRKRPRRYDSSAYEGDRQTHVKGHYCQQYFKAIDLAVNSIKNRFEQDEYRMYCNLEQFHHFWN